MIQEALKEIQSLSPQAKLLLRAEESAVSEMVKYASSAPSALSAVVVDATARTLSGQLGESDTFWKEYLDFKTQGKGLYESIQIDLPVEAVLEQTKAAPPTCVVIDNGTLSNKINRDDPKDLQLYLTQLEALTSQYKRLEYRTGRDYNDIAKFLRALQYGEVTTANCKLLHTIKVIAPGRYPFSRPRIRYLSKAFSHLDSLWSAYSEMAHSLNNRVRVTYSELTETAGSDEAAHQVLAMLSAKIVDGFVVKG